MKKDQISRNLYESLRHLQGEAPELDQSELIRRDPPQIMTLVEASIYMDISDRMTRKLVNTGLLKHSRIGNRIRIRLEDVHAYLTEVAE